MTKRTGIKGFVFFEIYPLVINHCGPRALGYCRTFVFRMIFKTLLSNGRGQFVVRCLERKYKSIFPRHKFTIKMFFFFETRLTQLYVAAQYINSLKYFYRAHLHCII